MRMPPESFRKPFRSLPPREAFPQDVYAVPLIRSLSACKYLCRRRFDRQFEIKTCLAPNDLNLNGLDVPR